MYNKLYSSSSLFFKKKNIIYNIRDSLIFEIELCRKKFLLFSLVFNGPKIWNNINSDIKKSKSKSIFAKKFMTNSSIITINPIIQTFTFIKKKIFYLFFYVIIFNLTFI